MQSEKRSRRDAGQPRQVAGTLARHPTVARLAEQARSLGQLQERIAERLPASLNPHWSLAAARRERVLVLVDSATWGTRLRFCWPTIKAVLEEQGIQPPAQLQLRVVPAAARHREAGQPRQLSPAVVTVLRRAADRSGNPALALAWRRLLEKHTPSGGGNGD